MGGSKLPSNYPVIGLLFGIQTGLDVSIIDATDALYEVDSKGEVVLHCAEIEKKKGLWTAVYANYEMLGWYTLANDCIATPSHMSIHRGMCAFNEVPLFLLMNHSPEPDAKQLPLSIFEAEMHIIHDVPTQIFVDIDFKLETAQAERVAVDQVTKLTPTEGVSTLEVQNQSVNTSLRILERKIGTIIEALRGMRDGTLPVDHGLLRRAARICQQLPAIDSGNFQTQFLNELVDSLLVTYLSAATKTSASLSELTDTYSMVYGSTRRTF
jgi:COP9 signalosome complex subunit 6